MSNPEKQDQPPPYETMSANPQQDTGGPATDGAPASSDQNGGVDGPPGTTEGNHDHGFEYNIGNSLSLNFGQFGHGFTVHHHGGTHHHGNASRSSGQNAVATQVLVLSAIALIGVCGIGGYLCKTA